MGRPGVNGVSDRGAHVKPSGWAGGLPNTSAVCRKTLHVGYGPFWMMSQVCMSAPLQDTPFIYPWVATVPQGYTQPVSKGCSPADRHCHA